MTLPIVAIVGRPNVGKSSLLNYLAGRRISIVDPTEGVTRDRVTTPVDFDGKLFELTDTGGYGVVDKDNLTADIERQITLGVEEAQLVLFVVDAKAGVVPLDVTVAEFLRSKGQAGAAGGQQGRRGEAGAGNAGVLFSWGLASRCR